MRNIDRKIVILGDSGTGKTALVQRYVRNTFKEEYCQTSGATPSKKTVEVDGRTINLIIWDVAGHIARLHPAFFSEAHGAILVCDLTRSPSLEILNQWRAALVNKIGNIPIIVAASKSDLAEMPLCKGLEKTDYTVIATSAKTGKNVEQLFLELAKKLI